MNSVKKITVLIADDHMIVREGIRKLLEPETDIEVVGEADTGREAAALNKKLHPDVIIMDIAMPQMNGLEATRQIIQDDPKVKLFKRVQGCGVCVAALLKNAKRLGENYFY